MMRTMFVLVHHVCSEFAIANMPNSVCAGCIQYREERCSHNPANASAMACSYKNKTKTKQYRASNE